jgi:hypothetical protein
MYSGVPYGGPPSHPRENINAIAKTTKAITERGRKRLVIPTSEAELLVKFCNN